MTNKIEGLRLLSVEREEDYQATLKLADLENKLVYEVNFNKREFNRDTKNGYLAKKRKENRRTLFKRCWVFFWWIRKSDWK